MPFFFGPSERSLYGVYEAARGGARRGLVLCPPSGIEYFNAHRVIAALARQLAGAGVHALRFDLSGTGDSAGEEDEFSASAWREDVRLAMEELRDLAGIRRVGLLGLRAGTSIALEMALDAPDVDRLVLWDPVTSHVPDTSAPAHVSDVETVLTERGGAALPNTLLVSTSRYAESIESLAEVLAPRCASCQFAQEDERGAWESEGGIATLPVPVRAMRAIVGWCGDAS